MSDNKLDMEGLNASMDDFFKQFNPGKIVEKSPALKINTDMENKLFAVGFDIVLDDPDKVGYDTDDLNSDTLVMIDTRHMMECLMIISGALFCIKKYIVHSNDSHFIYNDFILQIRDVVCKGVVRYNEITKVATSICNDFSSNGLAGQIKEGLFRIIADIWFLPYSEIDKRKEKIEKELGGNNE